MARSSDLDLRVPAPGQIDRREPQLARVALAVELEPAVLGPRQLSDTATSSSGRSDLSSGSSTKRFEYVYAVFSDGAYETQLQPGS